MDQRPKYYVKKSIEDLFTHAKQKYDFTEEQVREILKEKNHSKFKAENYSLYLHDIQDYADYLEAKPTYPVDCPICHAKIVRRTDRDRHWGILWGWDCPADRFHFWDDRAHDLAKHIAKWNTDLEDWLVWQKDIQKTAHTIEVRVNQ